MPSYQEEFARILSNTTDRLTRIENAEYEEAVPNPIATPEEGKILSESYDSAEVSSQAAGSGSWGDPWSLSEWTSPDYLL